MDLLRLTVKRYGSKARQLWAEGYKVLRFWDNQIFNNLEVVWDLFEMPFLPSP
jgi:very-short-patch-repair endonuclease